MPTRMKHQHAIGWGQLDTTLPGWRGVLPAWEAKGAVSQPLKKPGTGRVVFPKGFVLPDTVKQTGLGDVVEKLAAPIAKVLGVTGCGGCAKRRAALNKLVPNVNPLRGKP